MFIDYSWYSQLIQPPLKPPAWLFAPVWTLLYISMGVSLFLYAKKFTNKKNLVTMSVQKNKEGNYSIDPLRRG